MINIEGQKYFHLERFEMYKVLSVIIILFSLTFSQETWTRNDYLKKSEQDILENSKNNQILIQTISGEKVPGTFIKYQGNELHYFERGQKNKMIRFLDDIEYIYAKEQSLGEGTIVFVGKYYKNFKPQTDSESEPIVPVIQKEENTSESFYNPCEDNLYLKLKEKDLDSLSEREYTYFLQAQKDCAEWLKQTQGRINKPVTKVAPQPSTKEGPVADYYINGVTMAENNFQTSASLGGLVSGFLGGFIGWGIGYAILSGMEVDVPYSYYRNLSTEDQYKFKDGYKSAVKKIRNKDFHFGAGVGTAAIIIITLVSIQ
ncbi:MAG: hypothetical protein PHN44_03035 [Candidatus Marinimicrobia bacterium]|nr:hypothetical protein [Candidatus Neomarinimicrobiota bacterium]